MANLGFNHASHPMPMGGNVVQSSPFINSGGPYSGQGMPLHASAHMAPPAGLCSSGEGWKHLCVRFKQSLTPAELQHCC